MDNIFTTTKKEFMRVFNIHSQVLNIGVYNIKTQSFLNGIRYHSPISTVHVLQNDSAIQSKQYMSQPKFVTNSNALPKLDMIVCEIDESLDEFLFSNFCTKLVPNGIIAFFCSFRFDKDWFSSVFFRNLDFIRVSSIKYCEGQPYFYLFGRKTDRIEAKSGTFIASLNEDCDIPVLRKSFGIDTIHPAHMMIEQYFPDGCRRLGDLAACIDWNPEIQHVATMTQAKKENIPILNESNFWCTKNKYINYKSTAYATEDRCYLMAGDIIMNNFFTNLPTFYRHVHEDSVYYGSCISMSCDEGTDDLSLYIALHHPLIVHLMNVCSFKQVEQKCITANVLREMPIVVIEKNQQPELAYKQHKRMMRALFEEYKLEFNIDKKKYYVMPDIPETSLLSYNVIWRMMKWS